MSFLINPYIFDTFSIKQSAVFNGSSSYFNKSWGNALDDSKKFTLSFWVKVNDTLKHSFWGDNGVGKAGYSRGELGDSPGIGQFVIIQYIDSAYTYTEYTSSFTFSINTWYHLVVNYDSTQATNTDRIKAWVNGAPQTIAADPNGGSVWPALNAATTWNSNHFTEVFLGKSQAVYMAGKMAEIVALDGIILGPTNFGYDDGGTWKAKTPVVSNYGGHGFYLNFSNSSAIGTDFSGKGNNWTNNSVSLSTTDLPPF